LVTEDGVEDGKELAHGGDESSLGWSATAAQAEVKLADGSVATAGDQRGHVQDVAHVSAAPGDGTATAHGARVAIDRRRHADQGGDAAAIYASGQALKGRD
jgi:hypothetical protein